MVFKRTIHLVGMVGGLGEYLAKETSKKMLSGFKIEPGRSKSSRANPGLFEYHPEVSNAVRVWDQLDLYFHRVKGKVYLSLKPAYEDNPRAQALVDDVFTKLERYQVAAMAKHEKGIVPMKADHRRVVKGVRVTEDSLEVSLMKKDNTAGYSTSWERIFDASFYSAISPMLKALMDARASRAI